MSIHLNDLVREMREFAEEHPFNNESVPDPALGFPLVDSGCARQFDVGYVLDIGLSLDVFPSINKRLWHLSIARDQGSVDVDEDTVRSLVQAFLGTKRVMQLPVGAFPPEMRRIQQFVRDYWVVP